MTGCQPANELTLHLVVSGYVQGVFYRGSMQREALRGSVSGWMRNRRDGMMEAVLHDEAGAVNAVVLWAQRGPELARIERVPVETMDCPCTGFDIRATTQDGQT
jgi:acylphosphatase